MDQKILDALKTINDKLGGTNDANEKWGSLLQEIAENIDKTVELPTVTSEDNGDVLSVVNGAWAKSDPPSSLPSVTSADNGDVLTVVDGAWDKAAPSGGGGVEPLLIEEVNSQLNKTFGEILDAISAGKMCVAHTVQNSGIDSIDYYTPVKYVAVKHSEGYGYTGNLEAGNAYTTTEDMASVEAIRAEYPHVAD